MTRKMTKTINELYNIATIPPMLLSLIIGICLGALVPLLSKDRLYAGYFDFSFLLPFFCSSLVSVASLSIFLNKYSVVFRNNLLSLLTWFLLPLTLLLVIIYDLWASYSTPMGTIEAVEIITICVMALHLILLVLTYYKLHTLKISNKQISSAI